MIGQDKLLNKINKLNIDNLPHSLLILGDKGSGRHTIFNMIVDKLSLLYFDITDNISQDTINEIYLKVEPIIYLIDINSISIKEANMLLKLVEEPLNNAYIIFIGKTKSNVIPTILNRCQIWEMEKYNEEQLKYFCSDYTKYFDIVRYCTTPGQVLYLKNQNSDMLINMKDMSDKIINYIGKANFANTLTISDKIAFKNEQDKWDYDIFIKILLITIKDKLIEEYSLQLSKMFKITSTLIKESEIAHINKKHLFENYLCMCSYVMR